MQKPSVVAVFVGSLRDASLNRRLALAVSRLLGERADCRLVEIGTLPHYDEDEEQAPAAAVLEFRRAVQQADAFLFVTPEYNRSVPGVLKNAIDWASRPYGDSAWQGKPVAVMGASVGMLGTARAQYHLRQTFVFLDMPTVNQPEVMIAHAHKHFDEQGNLTDETAKKLIRQLLEELVKLTRRLQTTE